ncbi:MAG TPA: acyl-CoA thioesterase domain-containing protein, partial [Nonomuraea sp.]|nr:acyl-CoA thioesterase domain-containing protein [Nonomuraea sp.]
MTKFDEATQAIRVDETTYDVCLDPGYAIGGPLNGGYLLAVILRAVVDASPFQHPVSTSAQFLKSPVYGPARVRIEQLKAGRTAAFTRATLVQDGVAQIESLITTATLGDVEPTYADKSGYVMPQPEDCAKLPDPRPESNMTFNAQMEMLFDPPTIGWLT